VQNIDLRNVEEMLNNKSLTECSYHILQKWFDFIFKNHEIKCDLFIYLRSKPEVAFERIKIRNRKEENSISLEYIKNIHELHEEWLIKNQHRLKVPIVIIDANKNKENLKKEVDKILMAILKCKLEK
jgi:deoxynucleoside kinase